jgi:MYXO-CTERM domain-containing protein
MHEWEFVHASDGIIGFEPEDFVVDASGFLNSIANVYGVGEFSVVAPSNNSLAIQFTSAVPEPSGLVLAALALLGVALGGRRRKRSVTPGVAS